MRNVIGEMRKRCGTLILLGTLSAEKAWDMCRSSMSDTNMTLHVCHDVRLASADAEITVPSAEDPELSGVFSLKGNVHLLAAELSGVFSLKPGAGQIVHLLTAELLGVFSLEPGEDQSVHLSTAELSWVFVCFFSLKPGTGQNVSVRASTAAKHVCLFNFRLSVRSTSFFPSPLQL